MIDAAQLKQQALVLIAKAVQIARGKSGQAPIVPAGNVVGHALMIVIAIMTFLACLTIGAVSLVQSTAATWQSQISTEATIQVRPVEGQDMEALLAQASAIAQGFSGVKSTRIIDRAATARLLEPWLGTGLDIDELPVPRLVIVTLDEASPPDFAAIRNALVKDVAGRKFRRSPHLGRPARFDGAFDRSHRHGGSRAGHCRNGADCHFCHPRRHGRQ